MAPQLFVLQIFGSTNIDQKKEQKDRREKERPPPREMHGDSEEAMA
jgi:hypothetical protein